MFSQYSYFQRALPIARSLHRRDPRRRLDGSECASRSNKFKFKSRFDGSNT